MSTRITDSEHVLTGPNYPEWALSTRAVLYEQGLWFYVTGELQADLQAQAHAVQSQKAVCTIMTRVAQHVRKVFDKEEYWRSPKKLWEGLKDRYCIDIIYAKPKAATGSQQALALAGDVQMGEGSGQQGDLEDSKRQNAKMDEYKYRIAGDIWSELGKLKMEDCKGGTKEFVAKTMRHWDEIEGLCSAFGLKDEDKRHFLIEGFPGDFMSTKLKVNLGYPKDESEKSNWKHILRFLRNAEDVFDRKI